MGWVGRKEGKETVGSLTAEYTHVGIAVHNASRQGVISRPWGPVASFFIILRETVIHNNRT